MTKRPTRVQLYWLPHCSTCQKAKAFLEAQGLKVTLEHDLKANPLDAATVAKLAQAVGGAEALFSKRSMKYRPLGLHEQTLSEAELLAWMVKEYTFIKRPVMLFDTGAAACGFSQKTLLALLQG
jgi:arsenate reductase